MEELSTLCLDRASGELLWTRTLPGEDLGRVHDINGPASPTPCADAERVYVWFGGFGLVAYTHAGEEVWRRELPPPRNSFGPAASPVLAGGRLIFLNDNQDASWLEAIEPATGETLWRVEREGFGSGWSTPAVWRNGDVEELLVYGVWWLTGYDLATGAERWSVPGLSDEPIVTPVSGAGLVYVSSYNMRTSTEAIGLPTFAAMLERYDHDGDGQLDRAEADENDSVLSRFDADGEGDHPLRIFFRFLDVDQDGEITATEWEKLVAWLNGFEHANAVVAVRPGDGETGAKIAWQFPRGVPENPSPLYYRERVYTVKNGGLATCLDARTGAPKWEGRIGSRGPCYASPVAGDGKLYHASARGVVTVFRAADELEVLSHCELGERVMATPALADGRVYVRTEAALYAFGD
jgi:outer membrane protein assembly factor BamB